MGGASDYERGLRPFAQGEIILRKVLACMRGVQAWRGLRWTLLHPYCPDSPGDGPESHSREEHRYLQPSHRPVVMHRDLNCWTVSD